MGIPIKVPRAGASRATTTSGGGGGLNEVSSGADIGAAGGWSGFSKPGTFQGNTGGTAGTPNYYIGTEKDPSILNIPGPANYANTLGELTKSDGSASTGGTLLSKGGGGTPPPGGGGPTPGTPIGVTGRAPTAAEVAANPNLYKGTSFDPARNLMQGMNTGLATNMGMQGSQNVGGTGMYTGSNGPLDLSRFTPQGGAGTAWYNHLFGKNNPNQISYLGFMDQLGRKALGGRQYWSDQGALQDQLDYMNSEEGQTWLAGLMGIDQQQQAVDEPVDEPATGGADPGPEQTIANLEDSNPLKNEDAKSIVDGMLKNGVNPNEIPIQLRLMAQGIQPKEFTSQGYTPVKNPFLQMMQNGMGNPFMKMMMALGGGQK